MHIKTFIDCLIRSWLQRNSGWIIALLYGDFWSYKNKLEKQGSSYTPRLYSAYTHGFGAFVGRNAHFEGIPVLPHGLYGIFISNSAVIGKHVIIYHHVTIGSNTVKGSKGYGAPTIEDGVLIGAGAKIIGNITIGKNSRIGAGCVVTRSVPPNSVVVMPGPRIIEKESLKNEFLKNDGSLFVSL